MLNWCSIMTDIPNIDLSFEDIQRIGSEYTLRISLPYCNLKCIYCRRNKDTINPSKLMSKEDILETIHIAKDCGISSVRWTGGEPTVYPDFIEIIKNIKDMGIKEQMLSTNGTTLYELANIINTYGISRVNISLDTLDREKYRAITGFDYLPRVLESIDKSVDIFNLIKINTVLTRDNRCDVPQLIDFILSVKFKHNMINDNKLVIRFIELIWGGFEGDKEYVHKNFYSGKKLVQELQKNYGQLNPTMMIGDNPMCYYNKIVSKNVIFGIIPHFSVNFQCGGDNCKKLRLNPSGWISNCSIYRKFGHNIIGCSYDDKLKIMKHLILEKSERDEKIYSQLKHYQSDYHFWRFGTPSK